VNNAWSIPLDRLAQRAQLELTTVARKVTFDLFREVVLRSPVDTGRFRANWNVTYGSPNYGVSNSTAQARGFGEAAKALTLPVGGLVYLANGLQYAAPLEFGSSKQAPQGMVRLSVQRVNDFVARAIR
jgi:hypothetical protein